jgi:hypothetical protein
MVEVDVSAGAVTLVEVSDVEELLLPFPQAATKAPSAKTNKSFFMFLELFVSEF